MQAFWDLVFALQSNSVFLDAYGGCDINKIYIGFGLPAFCMWFFVPLTMWSEFIHHSLFWIFTCIFLCLKNTSKTHFDFCIDVLWSCNGIASNPCQLKDSWKSYETRSIYCFFCSLKLKVSIGHLHSSNLASFDLILIINIEMAL